MAFRRTYDEIREMIKRTVLTASMARDILRKAGFRPGATNTLEGGGVPPGGLKGWALAKKSDADFHVWWVPNGPYDTDWINDPSLAGLDPAVETKPTFPPAVLNDSIGDFSQPASVMASNWSAINEPLRSGVSNQGNLGFVYDPWDYDPAQLPTQQEIPKPTLHEAPALGSPLDLIDIANASTGSGDMSVSRTAHHAQAPRQWRLQAYVTQCSSDAVLYAHRDPGLFDLDISITMPLSGPGYYDSGWQVFPAASRSQTVHHVHRIYLYEPSIRDPAIPFAELQMRLYEFPKWFDWMYQR